MVFENGDLAMDWGVVEVRNNKLREGLQKARTLMHMAGPGVLVMEDQDHASSRRCERVKQLLDRLGVLGKEEGIRVKRYSRDDVLRAFGKRGAECKEDIAEKIAEVVPELSQVLPPHRREWHRERYTMPIFDAAALALTYFDGE